MSGIILTLAVSKLHAKHVSCFHERAIERANESVSAFSVQDQSTSQNYTDLLINFDYERIRQYLRSLDYDLLRGKILSARHICHEFVHKQESNSFLLLQHTKFTQLSQAL